jgi:hypothetical protein
MSPSKNHRFSSSSPFPSSSSKQQQELQRLEEEEEERLSSIRMEARAWLLLVSGETVLSIRTLLDECGWDTSIAFCEHVRASFLSKQQKEQKEQKEQSVSKIVSPRLGPKQHVSGKEGRTLSVADPMNSFDRMSTLLFEEVLAYCMSTHGPSGMLERVWPLMPANYSIEQLFACLAPFGNQQSGGLSASGSSASFGAMEEILKKLTRERWSKEKA